jgi:hypothetical protein
MTRRLDFNKFDEQVEEKSSCSVIAVFRDSATGATFAPNSLTWTLTDQTGSKTYASGSVVAPTYTYEAFMFGDHLSLSTGFTGKSETRIFTMTALYNKGTEINVPLRNSCRFEVRNLKAIT